MSSGSRDFASTLTMTHRLPELDALLFLDELVGADAPDESATSSSFALDSETPDELLLDSLFACDAPAAPLEGESDAAAQTSPALSGLASASRGFGAPAGGRALKRRPRRSASYDPNRARNARRHELTYLRAKVAEMETQLKQLQGAAPETHRCGVAAVQTQMVSATPWRPSPWEKVATRQRDERYRAERENARLTGVLEAQLQVAKSLEALLYRRATKAFEEGGLANQARVFATHTSQTDSDVFDKLLRQVDACYAQAERVFKGLGHGDSGGVQQDAKLKYDAERGVHMEIFASDVLPFALHHTSRAAWQYFSHNKNHMPFRLYYERVSEKHTHKEDTIVENHGIEETVNNIKAVSRVKQVLRRYVEQDRVVIAFCAVVEPVEFADKPVHGYSFREWGCMVLQRSQAETGEEHTALRTCYFIIPNTDTRSSSPTDIPPELLDFFLQSSAAMMTGWYQLIENILVDEELNSRG